MKHLPLLALIVGLACSRAMTRHELYWPYELWDGMNRMTFALEELGYELVMVDTERGTILARRWPAERDRGSLSGVDAKRPCEFIIQFPSDPAMPITIAEKRPEPPLFGLGDKDLQRIIGEIAAKFHKFGGVVEEVKARD